MLASYLKQMRSKRIVSHFALGQSWSHNDGLLEKTFTFADYAEAANFINRYTDHCASLNFKPEWSNVYNRVNVRIQNAEFKTLTAKEVEMANFLDRVSKQTLHKDIEEVMAFD